MFGKKPPGIGKFRIECALKSSMPATAGVASAADRSSKRKSPRQKSMGAMPFDLAAKGAG